MSSSLQLWVSTQEGVQIVDEVATVDVISGPVAAATSTLTCDIGEHATAGEERLYVIGSRGYHILTIMVAYAILALVWAIAGVGNVSNIRGGKAAGMWAMYTSTVWSFFYLVWLCTQWSWTMEKPGWAVVHALV